MSAQPQLFKIKVNSENQDSKKIVPDGNIEEIDFTQLELLEKHIQEWVAGNPGILGEELLIIGKEFSGFDQTSEKLDLLAVDKDGKLVVIELKRDDSGSNVHWQAIKYASYLQPATSGDIIDMLVKHENTSEEEAEQKLKDHVEEDNLDILNNDQRIILVSHRFAPQVTSAALWLNEKAHDENLITCVQLIPYVDGKTKSLYVQASTTVPIPGVNTIGVCVPGPDDNGSNDDEVTEFLRRVASIAIEGLPVEVRPNMQSYRGSGGKYYRWYRLWYSRSPWASKRMRYYIGLSKDESVDFSWRAEVGFQYNKGPVSKLGYSEDNLETLENTVHDLTVHPRQTAFSGTWCRSTSVRLGDSHPLGDAFAKELSDTLRPFIEAITPEVDAFEDERTNE